mmetsp:Transcript_19763/g.30497  ORF Transcript_19763/g.30497 Transcript_19763/m.30497 type:complete len:321 (-) Transcript_19763:118-1080(-)
MKKFFCIAREGDWENLVHELKQESSVNPDRESLLSPKDDVNRENILHQVCYNSSVTAIVIETVLDIGGPQLAAEQNYLGQTPLHIYLTCTHGGASVAVCRALVIAKPETVRIEDNEYLRAIDVLYQKIIMKEERARYQPEEKQSLEDLWANARIIVEAFRPTFSGQQSLPMVHACLEIGEDCPFALWERALQQFPDDIFEPGENGNLPLHIAASTSPPDELEVDLLNEILKLFPKAASIRNNKDQLPLDLAISSGRTWRSGIGLLLDAYPLAIDDHIQPNEYPLILSHFSSSSSKRNILFQLLLGKPDLFVQAKNCVIYS